MAGRGVKRQEKCSFNMDMIINSSMQDIIAPEKPFYLKGSYARADGISECLFYRQ